MAAHSSLVVDLHHINFGQVVLHLLEVLCPLAVDHVEDMLDLVWAHVVAALVR